MFRNLMDYLKTKAIKDTGNSTKQTRDSVKRVYSACVMDLELVAEQGGQEDEARGGHHSSQSTKEDSKVRLKENVSNGTNDDSASQACILNMVNVELALTVGHGADNEGSDHGGDDGKVGVHHSSLLSQS